MGIVVSQSLKSTILSYAGVIIGIIYTIFLVPTVFNDNPEHWGLVQLLISYVQILLNFSVLGIPGVILKFVPKYRIYKRELLFFFLLIVTFGIFLMSLLFYFSSNLLIRDEGISSKLIDDHKFLIYPILISNSYLEFFSSYLQIHYKTTISIAIKTFFIKAWTLITIVLYASNIVGFECFITIYSIGYVMQLVLIVLYLIKVKEFRFNPIKNLFKSIDTKEVIRYGAFGVLGTGTSVLVSKIDIVMIGRFLDLKQVAYYSVAFFFITVLQVPIRSISVIVEPIISEYYKNHDLVKIREVYKKTSLSFFIIVLYIFGGIWLSIEEVMSILGDKFGEVSFVILAIGVAKIFEFSSRLNTFLITISNFYKYNIIFQGLLLILTVITNIFFIPKYGINGAAIATAITIISNNFFKLVFVYKKFHLIPYDKKSIKVLLLVFCGFFIGNLLSSIEINVFIKIILKAIVFSILFILPLYIFKVSSDINSVIDHYKKNLLRK